MSTEIVNLKKRFPISYLYIIKKSFKLFMLFLSAVGALYLLYLGFVEKDLFQSMIEAIVFQKILFVSILAAGIFLKMFYTFIYMTRYNYYLDGDRLAIETGVILRREASIPLTVFSEFDLREDPLDFLLGTKNLIIKSTQGEGKEMAKIECLKTRDARKLRDFLIEIAEAHVPTMPYINQVKK